MREESRNARRVAPAVDAYRRIKADAVATHRVPRVPNCVSELLARAVQLKVGVEGTPNSGVPDVSEWNELTSQ